MDVNIEPKDIKLIKVSPFIDDRSVQPQTLKNGDSIENGQLQLEFNNLNSKES